ncbi:oligo-1,6-glucosidase [Talaromyces stipitatus ATCC 10500]|uniref:Oligo-1,6-glucosidase n=1 Tax=Talaromyces stipitatus (strain ATCC 10500 / CBS 375.48 / QM 6759 / NRRL 1006) TaxID=441959 RepID=B8MME5_TALSN|nr:oligo-1,6-glucosidase [Talaromyces stipitatus ATCC 10500]EED13699.1 oligo-1,6-glucosidase [Talaromyces stipitatus ATCC 10500]
MSSKPVNRAWWKEASVYQIWPASYKDSNNDGIGDIPGIISKLDYIQQLGVDILWLSPSYKSPQVDMGYDISDYYSIHPPHGTVEDVDKLISGCHERGMKLLMDLVVNHTSDQHEWFQKSKRSKENNEFRDWYIWKPPRFDEQKNRHPPNNWVSHFQGSAWKYDELTEEYYLHLYAEEQPDLNWEHPPVRKAVHDIIRFWLNKGCDGFRMDVINFISKHQDFPDAPPMDPDTPWQWGYAYYANGPQLHEYLQEIGKILQEYDAFSVGEMPFASSIDDVLKAIRFDRKEINMIFDFEHVDIDHGKFDKFAEGDWKLTDLKRILNKWQTFMYENDGWNALYWENHDQPRSIDRYTDASPEYSVVAGKMLATCLALMAGTPFIYQGQELGMRNVPTEHLATEPDNLQALNSYRKQYQKKSRDNARTPVQWTAGPNAGFTSANVKPWMSINPNHTQINAENQLPDPTSAYNYWRSVLSLRKKWLGVFVYDDFVLVDRGNEQLFVYTRQYQDQKALVICNFTVQMVKWGVKLHMLAEVKEVLLNTYGVSENYLGEET